MNNTAQIIAIAKKVLSLSQTHTVTWIYSTQHPRSNNFCYVDITKKISRRDNEKTFIRNKQSSLCLPFWITVMLIHFKRLMLSAYWNAWVRSRNIRTASCLWREAVTVNLIPVNLILHLLTRLHHFRFNSHTLTRWLNWTSNQEFSLSPTALDADSTWIR